MATWPRLRALGLARVLAVAAAVVVVTVAADAAAAAVFLSADVRLPLRWCRRRGRSRARRPLLRRRLSLHKLVLEGEVLRVWRRCQMLRLGAARRLERLRSGMPSLLQRALDCCRGRLRRYRQRPKQPNCWPKRRTRTPQPRRHWRSGRGSRHRYRHRNPMGHRTPTHPHPHSPTHPPWQLLGNCMATKMCFNVV